MRDGLKDIIMKNGLRGGKRLRMILIAVAALCVAAAVIFIVYKRTSYNYLEVTDTYDTANIGDGDAVEYSDGFLICGPDGVSFLTRNGKKTGEYAIELSNPLVAVCKDTAVVADRGGTKLYVFKGDGLKGEIKTEGPVERASVSSQGVVAAVLRDDLTPKIVCYDSGGNVLASLTASLSSTGYPTALGLSPDGSMLAVTYLLLDKGDISTRAIFYDFDKEGGKDTDYQVAEKEYKDVVIPTAGFMRQDMAVFVTDSSVIFYDCAKKPKEEKNIKIKGKIYAAAVDKKRVALLIYDESGDKYSLHIYGENKDEPVKVALNGRYTDLKLSGGMAILRGEGRCVICGANGVCKYEGPTDGEAGEIFAAGGLNRYVSITDEGFKKFRLRK